jgi:predicted TIM-barrel fold metal-dependent hydrolase
MSAHTAAAATASEYTGPIFDGDSHIQEESYDFFKQYLPKELHAKWLVTKKYGPDGRFGMFVGDRMVENAEANPEGTIAPPGRLKEWLRAMKNGEPANWGFIKPTPDMYLAEPRLKKLDEFGVDASLLFPGHFLAGLSYLDDPAAFDEVLRAYSRWMEDRWTFNYHDRIYPTPFLSLNDLDRATAEAEYLIKRGVRVVLIPMGPYNGRSPADPAFDPVWNRLNEAGVAVAFHIADAPFLHPMLQQWGEKLNQPRRQGQSAFTWFFGFSDLPIQMEFASFIYYNFFERFPNIRLCSVENGAKWLPPFLEKLDVMRGMAKAGYWPCGQLKRRPSEIFKQHCFVVAYPEDDVKHIIDEIGSDACLMMGSDYPHAEGVATPREFVREALAGLTPQQVANVMHENGRRFMPKS